MVKPSILDLIQGSGNAILKAIITKCASEIIKIIAFITNGKVFKEKYTSFTLLHMPFLSPCSTIWLTAFASGNENSITNWHSS